MATQIYGKGRNIHMGMVYIKVSIIGLLEEERQKDAHGVSKYICNVLPLKKKI